jgi:ATP-dependent exoDNAse (exonuclease V) alpha subunit
MKQRQALAVMLAGNSIFLTGPPGAGKTFVLNEYVRRAKKTGRRVAVTASTGIAATHINGTTIHSWSGLGIRDELSESDKKWLAGNDRLRKRYVGTDALVIDEVSMLHGKRLDMVNEACKLLRGSDEPFGGLQVILVGDLFQLPPVNRTGEMADFAHTSEAWAELAPKICYLNEQHRQQGGGLLDVLEAMRGGELSEHHGEILTGRLNRQLNDAVPVTRLYAHNVDVETINARHLAKLGDEAKTYQMVTSGSKAKIEQLARSVLAPETLELKRGAEVMFVANNFTLGFVNGSRGQVVGFRDGQPLVKLLRNGKIIKAEPHSWTLQEDGKKRAEVIQLPLRLAWAITIHKSQGMSLDGAEIDLSKSFTPGMGYVALSRVRSLDGLYLLGLNRMALQMHPEIFEFDNKLKQTSAVLAASTPEAAEETIGDEPAVNFDKALFDKLRTWRLRRARRDKVAPFIIAHNTLLEELAARPPANARQLLGTKGFGAKKLETYGPDILEILAKHAKLD